MQANLASATGEAQSGGTRAAVLGINDGLVTNISLILGVAGGAADVSTVKLAGIASLVAGACSMAVGEYVSMQAQVQLLRRVLSAINRSFADDGERLSGVKRAFAAEGLSEEMAAQAAVDLGKDCDKSVDLYARVVLGINPGELGSPWISAIASLLTFAVGAFVPLIPWYFFDATRAIQVSIVGSAVAAFAIGALLGYHTDRRWLAGAVRQVIVIVLAASVTYGAGLIFHSAVH